MRELEGTVNSIWPALSRVSHCPRLLESRREWSQSYQLVWKCNQSEQSKCGRQKQRNGVVRTHHAFAEWRSRGASGGTPKSGLNREPDYWVNRARKEFLVVPIGSPRQDPITCSHKLPLGVKTNSNGNLLVDENTDSSNLWCS